jgi:hypothetical protein
MSISQATDARWSNGPTGQNPVNDRVPMSWDERIYAPEKTSSTELALTRGKTNKNQIEECTKQ